MEKIVGINNQKHTLFEKICEPSNLWLAAHKTLLHGKRYRGEGALTKLKIEKNLLALRKELIENSYKPGKYHSFMIYEPKQREVLAAPLKDRILHHAINNQIEPIIDKKFIHDSYACRKGKGTLAALKRAKDFLRKNDYFVHLDVKKYFNNIQHNTLKHILNKKIHDPKLLELIFLIIDSSLIKENKVDDLFSIIEEKGLPIGNLTSQLFANLYLNELDQYIKHELKCKHYIRYMDDFVVFSCDKEKLLEWHYLITAFCSEKLKLQLHIKGGIKMHNEGLRFLGFVIYRNITRLKGVCLTRFLRKYKKVQNKLSKEYESIFKLLDMEKSWNSHLMFANANSLRKFLNEKHNMNLKIAI